MKREPEIHFHGEAPWLLSDYLQEAGISNSGEKERNRACHKINTEFRNNY